MKDSIKISLIFDDQLIKKRKPGKVLVNRKVIYAITQQQQWINCHNGDIVQVKIDRFTGSRRILVSQDMKVIARLNKSLIMTTLISAVLFLLISIFSFRLTNPNVVLISASVIVFLALFVILSFTIWRNQWVIIQEVK
jgi:presenilin-like A22 family membrane protease